MNMNNVLFIAANTARSQAYAQAMAKAEIYFENVLFFEIPTKNGLGKSNNIPKSKNVLENLLVPDLSIPLSHTIEKICNHIIMIQTDNINDDQIYKKVQNINPRLIIYSGYGGQILKSDLLNLKIPILHIHSGWLPEFRGSTTIYYSILKMKKCGVTAFLMSKDIDMGIIVGRKYYPAPPPDFDIDYLYDNAIRANFLIEVLKTWNKNNAFKSTLSQQSTTAQLPYYVMHPVLKHIAILSLPELKKHNK